MADVHIANQSGRVQRHTTPEHLKRIEEQIEESVRFYSTQPTEAISRRICELEAEWSIERYLDTNASTLALTGALLGLTVSRKWLLLSAMVSGFLFQHATTGWCPPVPVFRAFGVRTRAEIDREKFALKALRGDFHDIELPERKAIGKETQPFVESVNA
jgi:hypothetical protein